MCVHAVWTDIVGFLCDTFVPIGAHNFTWQATAEHIAMLFVLYTWTERETEREGEIEREREKESRTQNILCCVHKHTQPPTQSTNLYGSF